MTICKRLIAALLALSILLTFCACGGDNNADDNESKKEKTSSVSAPDGDDTSKDDTTDDEPTDEPAVEEAEVGTILDAPEKIVDLKDFYVYFSYADESSETGVSTAEVALKNSVEPSIIYVTTGPLKLDEIVYEIDTDGNLTMYTKDVFAESFTKTEVIYLDAPSELQGAMLLLQLVGYQFPDANPNVKFKKCESETNLFTGDAYVYEMLQDGTSIGTVMVDKATGIFVKITDETGTDVLTVQEIDTVDLGLPEYK